MYKIILRVRRCLKYCPVVFIPLAVAVFVWLTDDNLSTRIKHGNRKSVSTVVWRNKSHVEPISRNKTFTDNDWRNTTKQVNKTTIGGNTKDNIKFRSDYKRQRNLTNFNRSIKFFKYNVSRNEISDKSKFKQKKLEIQTMLEWRRALVNGNKLDVFYNETPDSLEDINTYYKTKGIVLNPLNHRIILGNAKVCDKDLLMIAVIPSAAENTNIRRAIRETYGQFGRTISVNSKKFGDNVKIDYVFLLGKHGNRTVDRQVKQEAGLYKDIIKADFIDSYFNLTLKVLIGLKWVETNCHGVKYVLKIDDDVFVNIPLLVSRIEIRPIPDNGLVFGTIFNRKVHVVKFGKWAVKEEEYPLKFYPPYAQGTSYTLTGNLVSKIVNMSQYLPYLHIEDAFITGIIAGKSIGADLIYVYKNSDWFDSTPVPCEFLNNSRVAQTKMTPSLMVKTMKALTIPGYCEGSDKQIQ